MAVDSVADELMNYMISEQGCYLISKEEQDKLTATVITPKGLNRKCVGRDARTLLSMIGIQSSGKYPLHRFEGEKRTSADCRRADDAYPGTGKGKAILTMRLKRPSGWNTATVIPLISIPKTWITSPNMPRQLIRRFWLRTHLPMRLWDSEEKASVPSPLPAGPVRGLTSASTFTKRRRCVMSDSLCIR